MSNGLHCSINYISRFGPNSVGNVTLFTSGHKVIHISASYTGWRYYEPWKLKVVTIGGGSSYTLNYLKALLSYHELPVTEFMLADVEDGKRSWALFISCQRMIDVPGTR